MGEMANDYDFYDDLSGDDYDGTHLDTRANICDGEPRIQRRGDGTAFFVACSRYPLCKHTESIKGFYPRNGA